MDAHLFTAAASARLPGPPWLVARRAAAAERLASLALPTTSEEDWRYGRVDELDLAHYAPVGAAGPHGASGVASVADAAASVGLAAASRLAGSLDSLAARVRIVDGLVVESSAPPAGVSIRHGSALVEQPELLGHLVAPHDDAFVTLADAFGADVVVIEVAGGVHVESPILLLHEQLLPESPSGSCPATFPRTFVRLGAGASAVVVEAAFSAAGGRLVVPITESELADDARLELYQLQELGRESWSFGYQASRLGRRAELTSFSAALGGDYARQLTRCELLGEGGASRLYSVFLGDGDQLQDLRTFQEHVAPRTTSQLVFKGAVADKARSVYTGLIGMRKGARRAQASQTNRNLVLSEGAHADSVPNLDIEENDVHCSHASAVGPVDPELLFYLESRGVEPAAARRLVLLGFFEELLSGLGVKPVAAHVRSAVAERLVRSLESPPESGTGSMPTSGAQPLAAAGEAGR